MSKDDTKLTPTQATVEVFWLAFRSLPKKERREFYEKLANDREFLQDVRDLALVDKRRKESSKSLDDYLAGN